MSILFSSGEFFKHFIFFILLIFCFLLLVIVTRGNNPGLGCIPVHHSTPGSTVTRPAWWHTGQFTDPGTAAVRGFGKSPCWTNVCGNENATLMKPNVFNRILNCIIKAAFDTKFVQKSQFYLTVIKYHFWFSSIEVTFQLSYPVKFMLTFTTKITLKVTCHSRCKLFLYSP